MPASHDQIKRLTRAERLNLVQEIWGDLAAEGEPFQFTAAQAAELDRRLQEHRVNPGESSTLEEMAAALGVRL